MARLLVAASRDADVFRGMLEIAMCVALPQDVIARPHVAAKLAELDGLPLPPNPASSIGIAWRSYWAAELSCNTSAILTGNNDFNPRRFLALDPRHQRLTKCRLCATSGRSGILFAESPTAHS